MIDKKTLKELVGYTWELETQLREELLQNFMKLSQHHSRIDQIRDKLINIELLLNHDTNQKDDEVNDGS